MSFLLDTNLVSEVMRTSPEPLILSWLKSNEDVSFLSSITVGEIERGIGLLPAGRKRQRLQEAFAEFVVVLEERVLGFDFETARYWAQLTVAAQRAGRKLPVLDSMIEATALRWNLTLVTRNTNDFFRVATLNPWSSRP